MKIKLCRHIVPVLVCLTSALKVFSQTDIHTDFRDRVTYIFANIEKNRVPNGLLLDYAMEFADLKSYSGTLTDSNKVNSGILRDIYSTVAMSAIHSNSGGFFSPDYYDSIWQIQRQPGIITLSGLYYNYSRFRDDAISSNKLTVANDQFTDKYQLGIWQNPYQQETVFAMSPPLHAYRGKMMQVKLPPNLWCTNNGNSVSSIAADFGNGNGYQTLTMGQALTVNYADTGIKTWKFRLTLTNNTMLYSHTEMQVLPNPNNDSLMGRNMSRFLRPGGPLLLTSDAPFLGEAAQGWITVDYATPPDINGRLRLTRPLIVAEGFDPGYLLDPELLYGHTDFNSFTGQLRGSSAMQTLLQSTNQQFDIIYVDWKKGADYLQRNALLLERVIRWVNEQKALDGSLEQNVVLGQSMGGVIARWALRDMENKGLNHQTRLYVSYDAPHLGANVPLSYQHAARHANSVLMGTVIPILIGGSQFFNIRKNALNLMDFPAAKQMLYNRVLNSGALDNTAHTLWQNELRNIGYPTLTRNIAISNGSECGIGQGFQPNAELLYINGRANTRVLADFIGMTGIGSSFYWLSLITLKPQFLLGILPGRNDLLFDFSCRAQPSGASSEIYRGKITYRKKLLWLVNINTTITNRTRNADPSLLPIDGAPGGMTDTDLKLHTSSDINWWSRYSITVNKIPQFNFIPTTSALDIGSGNTALSLADYNRGFIGAAPPVAPLNSPFANFTTAFNQVLISNGNINNNEHHTEIANRNGNWLAQELNGNTLVRTDCSGGCANNEIVGPSNICTNAVFSIAAGTGSTVAWSASPAGIVSFSCTNCAQPTITRIADRQVVITAIVTLGAECGGSTQTYTKTVVVGVPYMEDATYTRQNGSVVPLALNVAANSICNMETTIISGTWPTATSANWTGPLNTSSSPTQWYELGFNAATKISRMTNYFYLSPNTATWTATGANVCGSKSYNVIFSSSVCSGPPPPCLENYSISPNPSNGRISIMKKPIPIDPCPPIPGFIPASEAKILKVIVYDEMGNPLKTINKVNAKNASLDINTTRKGVYIVEITSSNTKVKHKVIIN